MSDKFYEQIEPGEIAEDIEYCGYLWRDNESTPQVINGTIKHGDIPEAGQIPYVIEGNLVAEDGSHSISIRFVEGRYIIGKVDLQAAKEAKIHLVPHNYLAHRGFGETKKLCFDEAWLPVDDPLCKGMKTLQPAWIAFVGFDCKEDNEND